MSSASAIQNYSVGNQYELHRLVETWLIVLPDGNMALMMAAVRAIPSPSTLSAVTDPVPWLRIVSREAGRDHPRARIALTLRWCHAPMATVEL